MMFINIYILLFLRGLSYAVSEHLNPTLLAYYIILYSQMSSLTDMSLDGAPQYFVVTWDAIFISDVLLIYGFA